MPEALYPEVGDPGTGALEGQSPAPAGQRDRAEAQVATDAREHSGENRAGCPRRRGSVRRGLERGDELAAPEDPLISYVGLAASAQGLAVDL